MRRGFMELAGMAQTALTENPLSEAESPERGTESKAHGHAGRAGLQLQFMRRSEFPGIAL